MTDSLLVDLSYCQGATVPFDELAGAGVIGSIQKCSHGANRTARDGTFARNWKASKAAGMIRGAYLWIVPEQDPIAQIDNALDAIDKAGGADDADLAISIDFEQKTAVTGRRLIDIGERAAQHAIEQTRRTRVQFYTGRWYWREFCLDLDSSLIAAQDNWHAEYPSMRRGLDYDATLHALGSPHLAMPWASRGIAELLWQFDGNDGLRLPNGVDADFNRYRGTRADLAAHVASTVPQRSVDPGGTFDDTHRAPLASDAMDAADDEPPDEVA